MIQTSIQSGGVKKFKVREDPTAPKPPATGDGSKPPTGDGSKPPATSDGSKPPAEATATGATKKRVFKVKAADEEKSLDTGTRKEILERFFKGRIESPDKYTYGPDGNLVVLDETGKPIKTIPMMNFRSLNAEEVVELSRQRMEEVRKYEAGTNETKEGEEEKPERVLSYVEALANLRDVYTKYKRGDATANAVKDANKKVMDAEKLRNKALYPLTYPNIISNPKIKEILLDSKDIRRIGYPVYSTGHFPFKKPDAFGHYVSAEEEAELARKTAMKGGSAIDVILIETYDDPARGFLHPAYTKDFSYTSTQFSSVYQAYEVERLKLVRNQTLVDQLMKTRSPRTIASIAAQDKTAIPNSFDLWFSILKAFYQQNTDLAKKLTETGSAIFSLRDTTISSPSEYLNALMAVRSFLAEKQEGGAAAPVDSHVITEEEQKKARVGAIINARRMG
jgi:hypothetical protein